MCKDVNFTAYTFSKATQIHVVFAAHQQSQASPCFIPANVQEQFDTFTRIGELIPFLAVSVAHHPQSSLTTWLAHSKKKTCDVCKYPYSFTKGGSLSPSILGWVHRCEAMCNLGGHT